MTHTSDAQTGRRIKVGKEKRLEEWQATVIMSSFSLARGTKSGGKEAAQEAPHSVMDPDCPQASDLTGSLPIFSEPRPCVCVFLSLLLGSLLCN